MTRWGSDNAEGRSLVEKVMSMLNAVLSPAGILDNCHSSGGSAHRKEVMWSIENPISCER